jgi:uncharacterized RDD family membrane protein YckC
MHFFNAHRLILISTLKQMEETQQNLLTDFEEPTYRFVGLWPRFGALVIDGIVLWAVAIPLRYILSDWSNPLSHILTSLVPFLYNPLLEYRFGATIGKMALGIKIVNYNLEPLTISNVILRNIIYFAFELVSLTITLYGLYNVTDGDAGGFRSMADVFSFQFTPEVMLMIIIVIIYIVEVVFLLTDERYRSLHDRIGKTYVVRKNN